MKEGPALVEIATRQQSGHETPVADQLQPREAERNQQKYLIISNIIQILQNKIYINMTYKKHFIKLKFLLDVLQVLT